MRWAGLLIVGLVAACDEAPPATPDLIAHPEHASSPAGQSGADSEHAALPAGQSGADSEHAALPAGRSGADSEQAALPAGQSAAPPPWPAMALTPGRYSPAFAADYVAQVNAERQAFDAEMAKPKEPPKDANDAKHRAISEKGRRARLMNKPQLADMTDAQISDVLSYSPDMPSAPGEFARLLDAHPQDVHICVDHARWFQFRHEKEHAIAEYTRCGALPDASEEIRRYIHTQIAAVKTQR